MSGPGDRDDGRNIDPGLGALGGEAAGQAAPRRARGRARRPRPRPPRPDGESPTYYDRPVIKAPVWKATIAAYFFVGGATGACATLGAAAQLAGGPAPARPGAPLSLAGRRRDARSAPSC